MIHDLRNTTQKTVTLAYYARIFKLIIKVNVKYIIA